MKTTMKTGLAALLLLLAISCKKESVSSPSFASIKTQDNAAIKTSGHYIGEHFGGGVIFWMSKDSLHGLIADTVDLGMATWWNGVFISTGATETRIGSGYSNTNKIILMQGKGNYAASECARHKRSGYTDWFLPSKDELRELYKRKKIINGLDNKAYWSSSEYDSIDAWYQDFRDAFPSITIKWDSNGYYVRAVRAF